MKKIISRIKEIKTSMKEAEEVGVDESYEDYQKLEEELDSLFDYLSHEEIGKLNCFD